MAVKFKKLTPNLIVSELDELISPELVFTNHLGQIMSKQDDLSAHRSGFIKSRSIEQAEQQVLCKGDIAIVSVLSHIVGEIDGVRSDAALRYTRIWRKRKFGIWQVVVAHSILVNKGNLC